MYLNMSFIVIAVFAWQFDALERVAPQGAAAAAAAQYKACCMRPGASGVAAAA
jgi:hypothetical protein